MPPLSTVAPPSNGIPRDATAKPPGYSDRVGEDARDRLEIGSTPMAGPRPFGVTLVALIAWITGALQIVTGIFALFGGAAAVGIAGIVIGVITILVSVGLFGGSNGARILTAIVFLLNIAGSLYVVFAQAGSVWAGIGSIVLPLIGLILLFTSRANAFFR